MTILVVLLYLSILLLLVLPEVCSSLFLLHLSFQKCAVYGDVYAIIVLLLWFFQCTNIVVIHVTEVDSLQGLYPLKHEWMIGYSLETRLADQEVTQQQMWLWSKDSVNSTINQRLVEQTQEEDFNLEGSGGSTLVDTLSK